MVRAFALRIQNHHFWNQSFFALPPGSTVSYVVSDLFERIRPLAKSFEIDVCCENSTAAIP